MTDATWDIFPGGMQQTGIYNHGANWLGGVVPDGVATFFGSSKNLISVTANQSAGAWNFQGGSQFVFTVSQMGLGNSLNFTGAGITGVQQHNIAFIVNDGDINFRSGSTAGYATITNNYDIRFHDTATAGSAVVDNNGGIYFAGASSAGTATITNEGRVGFEGSSSGGLARIQNVGANAFVYFYHDFGNSKSGIGSIAGTGRFALSDMDVTVGAAGGSQTVSGIITGVDGGSFTKTGTGTLTLTGANTYTGLTTVLKGTLALSGAGVTTKSDGLTVNKGATLKGNITFAGTEIEIVTNKGTITGDVKLGAGNDKFLGTLGGTVEVFGGTGNDSLTGGAKADTLRGDAGNDTLNGGLGQDKLYGGGNVDTFIFNVAPTVANRDTIYDFNRAADTIQLESAVFKGIGPNGTLKAAAFKLGTQATDDDHRIIYNKATGKLFFDKDGSGAAAAIHFATLANKPTITNADFVVI